MVGALITNGLVLLSEIAEFRNGVNFVASQRGLGIPVINVKDFKERFEPDYAGLEELKAEAVRDASILQAGDVLFVRSNGNKELIGRSMYLRTAPPRPTTHSAFTIRMRIVSPNADPKYCAYFVRGGVSRRTLSAHGSGTNISNLNQDILSRLRIRLPPLEAQQRIAGVLSAYDDLIEVNGRWIAILEEMARRLFDEWFVEFRFPGSKTGKSSSQSDGWHVSKLVEIAEVNSDTLSPRNAPDTIHYIDISSVSPGTVNEIRTLGFSDAPGRARRRVRRGDVLWSMVRPNRRLHALMLHVKPDTIASTGFAVLRARAAPWSYFYLAVTTDEFVAYLEGRARGSAYPAVSASDFESATLNVPPKNLLGEFHKYVGPLLDMAATLHLQNELLRAARDLLLPRLISGEIDVSGAEREVVRAAKRAAAE
jgi:type I restriction enzyme S subunit